MALDLIAGIDASTQSCKVIVRELASGAPVRAGQASVAGDPTIDPAVWWEALQTAIVRAGGLDDVSAISVAAQQHGMVALNARGEVVRDALLWHDTSSAPQARALTEELGRDTWVTDTGLPLAASFTVTKVRWLRDNEPERADEVAAVALPHDWLTWRLRGFGPDRPELEELTTDRSDASGTAYWSPTENVYCGHLFEHAFGRPVILPRVLEWDGLAGHTAAVLDGLPAGLPIGVGGGDNAVAALGLGAQYGDAVVSIGTSGTVFARTPEPVIDLTGPVSNYADASGGHLPLVAMLNSARVLDAARRLFDWDREQLTDAALQADSGADGLTLLPFFAGERLPDLPDARASLHGMTLGNTTPENIARAHVEGVLCSLADGMDRLRAVDVGIERVILIGGGSRNRAVQEIAPGILGSPITVPAPDEYVALGACKQAALALGDELPEWEWQGRRDVPFSGVAPEVRERYASALATVHPEAAPAAHK